MYSNINRSTVTTKYTDYVRKLGEDHVRKVINTTPEVEVTLHEPPPEIKTEKKMAAVDSNPVVVAAPAVENGDGGVGGALVDAGAVNFSGFSDMDISSYIVQNSRNEKNERSSVIKFSDLFTADNSHALKFRLLHQAKSVFNNRPKSKSETNLVELVENPSDVNNRLNNDSRHVRSKNLAAASSVSVADIVSSSFNQPSFENVPTKSGSKVDYDPHEPLSSTDQMSLRHELLKNIRAISRATYYEDLYTGKVKADPSRPETEIIEILKDSNKEKEDVRVNSRDKFLKSAIIPSNDSGRVDLWVKESSDAKNNPENSQFSTPDNDNASPTPSSDNLHDGDGTTSAEQRHASLFHQSIWKEQHDSSLTVNDVRNNNVGSSSDSEIDTHPAFRNRRNSIAQPGLTSRHVVTNHHSQYSVNTKTTTNNNKVLPRQFAPSVAQTVYASSTPSLIEGNFKKRPYSFNTDSYQPVISIIPPSVHSFSSSVNKIPSHLPKQPVNYNVNPITIDPEQVKHTVKFPTSVYEDDHVPSNKRKTKKGRKVPGVLLRQNMNQWVAKKVWFFINGDEHSPRFEFRFRPGRDLKDLEHLYDILTKRFPQLPNGARYIFTWDGILVHRIEELNNEGSYVVSSTKKFKALNYDGKRNRRENGVSSDTEDHAGGSRRRPPSAPSQRKPPVIRIRRERSLNGVQWGSPQQQLSASENNLLAVTKPSTKNKKRNNISRRRSPSNEVPRLVSDVITTSASYNNINRPIERQVIRIINGADPSVQSQVLLNTKTSQPWHELVRDLGMAVKIGRRKVGNRMETLTGRMIQSYSQLRSELKVGNQAFYIYSESDDEDLGLIPNLQKHRLSVNSINNNNNRGSGRGVGASTGAGATGGGSTRLSRSNSRSNERKKSLAKTTSVSSSDLSLSSSDPKVKRSSSQRRRSHTRSPNRSPLSQNPSPAPSRSPSPSPAGNVHRLKAPLPQIL